MPQPRIVLRDSVQKSWLDYNAHMNDAAYVHVFSTAIDKTLLQLGLEDSAIEEYGFTVYTLENHVCYLQECRKEASFEVSVQMIDYDKKRLHVFLIMQSPDGVKYATSEQMLMGVSTENGKSAPFPKTIAERISRRFTGDASLSIPEAVGRRIGIPRYSDHTASAEETGVASRKSACESGATLGSD